MSCFTLSTALSEVVAYWKPATGLVDTYRVTEVCENGSTGVVLHTYSECPFIRFDNDVLSCNLLRLQVSAVSAEGAIGPASELSNWHSPVPEPNAFFPLLLVLALFHVVRSYWMKRHTILR